MVDDDDGSVKCKNNRINGQQRQIPTTTFPIPKVNSCPKLDAPGRPASARSHTALSSRFEIAHARQVRRMRTVGSCYIIGCFLTNQRWPSTVDLNPLFYGQRSSLRNFRTVCAVFLIDLKRRRNMTVRMPCSNDATKSATNKGNKIGRRCSSQSSAVRAKKAMFRKLRRQLLRRLHRALPRETRATTSPRDEMSVLNEAVNLIDQLHQAIFARVQSGQLPPELISYLGLVSTQASDPGKVVNRENCCTPGELYKKLQSRIPANFTSTSLLQCST
ncbi:hypothetical protein T03_4509 [Trichinella britovi]|uniref:Uncharacterized protein n=1 Tax=Trichinella britovi TaxID=45882 RepID=A0A0V1CUB0_TRIBR|nr:hypothetical protein T03_4509 [Trichinella britovi]